MRNGATQRLAPTQANTHKTHTNFSQLFTMIYYFHRRRIKTEEKAKVIPAAWGTELIQFLAALAIWHHAGWFEEKDEYYSTMAISVDWMLWKMDDQPDHTIPPPSQSGCSPQNFFSNHPCCLMVSAAFKFVPQPAATTFAFPSVCILLLLWSVLKGVLFAGCKQDVKYRKGNKRVNNFWNKMILNQ